MPPWVLTWPPARQGFARQGLCSSRALPLSCTSQPRSQRHILEAREDLQHGHSYHGRHDGATAERHSAGSDVTDERDRDQAGRPRQARPRDALGRPLPYGAAGVEPVPEEPLPPRRRWRWPRPWCGREGRSLPMRSWRPAGRLARSTSVTCGRVLPRSVCLTHAARGNSVGPAGSSIGRGPTRAVRRRRGFDVRAGPDGGRHLRAGAGGRRSLRRTLRSGPAMPGPSASGAERRGAGHEWCRRAMLGR